MSDMSLNELVGRFIELDEAQDELCTNKEAIQAALEDIKEQLKGKFDGYIKVYRKMEDREAAIDAEIKRLKERKKAVAENRESIANSIIAAMRATDMMKIESDFYTAQVRPSTPSVVIDAEEEVPEEYKKEKVTYDVDKTKLKKFLQANGGETEYAHLETGYSLLLK